MNISKGKVLLLGLGMQGEAVLHDLMRSDNVFEIIVGDRSPDSKRLVEGLDSDMVKYEEIDASDTDSVSEIMEEIDLVIELLPPGFTFLIANLAVENGINMVSTMYLQDPEETDLGTIKDRENAIAELDKKAKEKNIVILPEFGLDPGLDLMLAKQAVRDLDEVDELFCYGAGLPEYEDADNPLKYKFTWSVEGLLKTYKRPARILKNGEIIDIPGDEIFSKENVHTLDLEGLKGLLECYPNGDALEYAERLDVKEELESMARYTCRWEGHTDFWGTMVKSRFLDEEPMEVDGKEVSPIEFVAEHLKAQDNFWLKDDERDMAMIRMEAHGLKDGEETCKVYQLIDRRNLESGFTA
ncbi:MAG: saccharopine dehydrogenase C-terminal domain-containing protein, partial [Candidatus Thermoplasmatota archaeon]